MDHSGQIVPVHTKALTYAQALQKKAPPPGSSDSKDRGANSLKNADLDDLEAAIQEQVRVFNCIDLLHHVNSVTVVSGPHTWPNRFFHLKMPEYREDCDVSYKYVFINGSWDKRLWMRLVKDPNMQRNSVEALIRSKWVPLSEILLSRPEIRQPSTGATGFQEQLGWWHASRKFFDLMALPGEMRNVIYKYLVRTYVYPYSWGDEQGQRTHWVGTHSHGLLKSEWGPEGTHVQTIRNITYSGPNLTMDGAYSPLALLMTSKQIHEEVGSMMCKCMEFRFQGYEESSVAPSKIERFASTISTVHRDAIRQITLQGTPSGQIKWFNPLSYDGMRAPYEALQLFSPAVHLELKIAHRRKYKRNWDPYEDWPLKLQCWRSIVGKVLWKGRFTFAHFDKIELTGCVSLPVHDAYMQLLQDIKAGQEPQISEMDIMGQCSQVNWSEHQCAVSVSEACREDWCICQGVQAAAIEEA